MPYATILLLLLTLGTYLAGNPRWMWLDAGDTYQLVTYALCHGGWLHLAINLIAMLSFGPALERTWGWRVFLACYLLSAVVGGMLQIITMPAMSVVGASGALFGLFAAYTIQRPKARIVTLLVYPLPAWVVLLAYAAFSVLATLHEWVPQIAHMTHLGGIGIGVLFGVANNKAPD